MAKLLVIGASRGIGLETVKAALLAGHSVRALARSAASISIQNPNLEKVSGDALDTDTSRNALKEVISLALEARLRRQGRAGVDHQVVWAGLDHSAARPSDK
jgi:NAD(P)-dependent dehydrogenase (short-subunit alcohol dehydrogenase family)